MNRSNRRGSDKSLETRSYSRGPRPRSFPRRRLLLARSGQNPGLLYWRIDGQSAPHLKQPGKKPISLFHICRWIFLFFTVSTSSHVYASVPALVETPAEDGGGPGVVLVTMFPRPVAKEPCQVNLGESVELLVQNLDGWLTKLKDKQIIESTKSDDELVTEQMPKLRLFIDGRPMRTLQPAGW
jgi:hypothetical protein